MQSDDQVNLLHEDVVLSYLRSAPDGQGFIVEDGVLKPSLYHTIMRAAADADVPQHEHVDGEMPLVYDQQTFNALVAANTAMQTEISAMSAAHADTLAQHVEITKDLRDRIGDLKAEKQHLEGILATRNDENKKMRSERDETMVDRDYHRDNAAALQRRLDRSLGYLDRVIDDQEGYRDMPTMPAPKSPIGPDLGSIPGAMRRRDTDSYAGISPTTLHTFHPAERPRRY